MGTSVGAHSASAMTQIERTERGISRQCSGTVDPLKAAKPQSRSRPTPATGRAGSQAEGNPGNLQKFWRFGASTMGMGGALAPGRLRRLASISPQRLRTHFLAAHTPFSVLGATGLNQGGGISPAAASPGFQGARASPKTPWGRAHRIRPNRPHSPLAPHPVSQAGSLSPPPGWGVA